MHPNKLKELMALASQLHDPDFRRVVFVLLEKYAILVESTQGRER
jgi:hypothetical protein